MSDSPVETTSVSYRMKGKNGGLWVHGDELITSLADGTRSIRDQDLHEDLFDWILTNDVNVFKNKESGELIYSLACKRGNRAYAAKKNATLNEILSAIDGKVIDEPVPGLRSDKYRMTKGLFFTLTFSHKRYSPGECWTFLRSTGVEGQERYGVLNSFGANVTSIFGPNGKLTCKESDSSGYPAPHVLVILDNPVLVKKHIGKDGIVSWRLVDEHILQRIHKDKLSRKLSFLDVEAATSSNPVWPFGMMDVQGLVKGSDFKKHKNGFTYLFKYLIKTVSVEKEPKLNVVNRIEELSKDSDRTMFFTHLGNKCVRTRDIVFGKRFKDRVGILPSSKKDGSTQWIRLRTIPEWVINHIYNNISDDVSSVVSSTENMFEKWP